MDNKKTIIFAVGGTGGHLFPAQVLAHDLLIQKERLHILFAGSHLGSNRYFQKDSFAHLEISSATLFQKGFSYKLKSMLALGKGIWESYLMMHRLKPSIVIGFGSFHSFPVICAAWLKNIPFVLFEPNVVPGKVNRFFSKSAVISAVQFSGSKKYVNGDILPIEMPLIAEQKKQLLSSKKEARNYFGLDPDDFTLLVFGGSQGAKAINQMMTHLQLEKKIQIIHLTGNDADAKDISTQYEKKQLPACVKSFEDKMAIAWQAADFAICRAGASTLAEMIAFEVPAIMIPYPYAYDHQRKNAELMQLEIGGGILIDQAQLNHEKVSTILNNLIKNQDTELKTMRDNLIAYKQASDSQSLTNWIIKYLDYA